MPLDDHEQRILDEIERQFYEQDPDLARAVRNIDRRGRYGVRYPLAGLVIGIVVVLATFTVSRWIAIGGFALMVISATALAYGIRSRMEPGDGGSGGDDGSPAQWLRRFRRG